MMTRIHAAWLILSCLFFASASVGLAQSSVSVVEADGTYRLLKDGTPYPVRGVGGQDSLALLSAAGGNSIRTWSTDDLDVLLDAAHANGLTVCVGLWLGHERHGFDYQNDQAVSRQLEDCLKAVRQHKDHPAVLIWGIGNEMEGEGTNPAVWYAVDHIAREIKKIDSHHPTMTVIAELGEDEIKLRNIERFCPNIDVVGVNSYGGIASLATRYRQADIKKPYIVTEHGPLGPWEVESTSWGSPIEATSTAKAERYANGYLQTASAQPNRCLGSYAFLWGHKQETTATWFGMLLPDGTRLAAVDAMSKVWTGSEPKNRCPRIESLRADKTAKLKPGEVIKVVLDAKDPEGDSLRIAWLLRQDSVRIGTGGDFEQEEAMFADAVTTSGMEATVTIPDAGGPFRLFAYVKDNHGGGAVANLPLFVDAPIKPIPAPKPTLPLVIYDDGFAPSYAPSGFMGNTNAIQMTPNCEDRPHSGKHCLQVKYNATDQWGGVLWQSPPNDWTGMQPGGFDLTAASALEFHVRGESGNEIVSFIVGGIETENPYRDSAKAELKEVRLTTQWEKMRIPLKDLDPHRIKTGFGWSLAGQDKPLTFFLDEIRFVR
ncbi:MAG: glycoside hydrolase family 2 TIM barrel-domain containing protein [Pirellulaceae bacterium]